MLQIMKEFFTKVPGWLAVLLLASMPVRSSVVPAQPDSFPGSPAVTAGQGIPVGASAPVPSGLTAEKARPNTYALAGLHPMAETFVKSYITQNRAFLEGLMDKNRPAIRTIEQILAAHGLPLELKYLAIVESKMSRKAVSPMGAAGPWQLMPVTARSLGLRVKGGVDERLDIRKSTEAAATMLKRFHKEFGDWLLVIAAFNAGSGRMASALRSRGGGDFWSVEQMLPKETRQHVRKYIATHYCLEGGGGVTTGLLPLQPPIFALKPIDTDSLDIVGKFHSSIVARMLDMDPRMFDALNPGFDTRVGAEGFRLILPKERMQAFLSNRGRILEESVRYLLDPGTFEMDRAATEIRLPPVRLV
jgi:membrane-bound lytic murein transglycosylase D